MSKHIAHAISVVCFVGLCLAPSIRAQAAGADYKKLYDEAQGRYSALERRVQMLEESGAQDKYVAKDSVPENTLSFLTQTEISGFVSASYTYNFNTPASGENTGRGFDTAANEFIFNKAALSIEKPVEYGAFNWGGGYTFKALFGQDARFTQTDVSLGDYGDIFEANVVINVPVGNGIKLAIGKFGTPMGFEASYTEENYNWSGGLQWTLVEPFTHTGVRASYAFSPEWEVEACVFNGWDNVEDNNDAKSYMGHVTYTPRESTTVSLIGYGGPEQDDDTASWRRGIDFYIQQALGGNFTGVIQLDVGAEDGLVTTAEAEDGETTDAEAEATDGDTAYWWAGGLWLIYEQKDAKWNVAVRGDYLNDEDGVRTSGSPAFAALPDNTGLELYSLTATINLKPVDGIRIAPEVRWDWATEEVFDGKQNQVTLAACAVYSF